MEIETGKLQVASLIGQTVEERKVCVSAEAKAPESMAAPAKGLVESMAAPAKGLAESMAARGKGVAQAKAARGKGLAQAKAARGKGLAKSKPKPSQEEKENDNDDNAVSGETAADRLARLSAEIKASWDKRVAEAKAAREARDKQGVPESKPIFYEDKEDKYLAAQASEFRDTWNSLYSCYDGHFEETTKIPNKRFTHKEPALSGWANTRTTLQIFSVKVSRIRGDLKWPLQVFGMVAIRDCVDHARNIIFNRPRDNCQIITQEVPYLKLTGPSRAVLLVDPATFEVDLKVKGTTEAEDACLSFLAATFINFFQQINSEHFTRDYPCRLSTLEFELGSIVFSVEATIDVRIISGSWPKGFRGQFAASTASIKGAQVILLDSHKVRVEGYGKKITLSRCVVSAETGKDLRISVMAFKGDRVVENSYMLFKPMKATTSDGVLRLGFCELGFTISWSLVSSLP